jgi:hypothetical protein
MCGLDPSIARGDSQGIYSIALVTLRQHPSTKERNFLRYVVRRGRRDVRTQRQVAATIDARSSLLTTYGLVLVLYASSLPPRWLDGTVCA